MITTKPATSDRFFGVASILPVYFCFGILPLTNAPPRLLTTAENAVITRNLALLTVTDAYDSPFEECCENAGAIAVDFYLFGAVVILMILSARLVGLNACCGRNLADADADTLCFCIR
ncbi:hypothetical protein LX32DRAFT_341082 [Colletotrichum zoysiae]|uniref:Uncharacterized protein n=1 Tax=Colletotrichum zoysiae TaxID=1216348 RepID=A0AAD9M528_9PEZI|nr:hypothetical protein LX32DRAFT_341082 [Colletotrichum zoysiae]